MKTYQRIFIALSVLTLSGSLMCTGCSENSSDSSTTMRTSSFEGTQGKCTNGGVKVEVLVNGSVDDAQTQYICNGAQGQNGQDGQNGVDGKNASIQTTAFAGEQGSCTNGGVKVDVVIDGEVQAGQTQYICNNANGQDGHSALVNTSDEVGPNCANGGTRIDFGLDANDNGTLDTAEILSTRYVCNGTNGQDGHDGQNGQNGQNGSDGKNANIQTTAFTGTQGTCTNGGIKVDVLIDGIVQADQTKYICNGMNGQDGQNGSDGKNASIQTTAFTGAQGTCTNGGVKVDVLIDGVIQAGQTQYICNGANAESEPCVITQENCYTVKKVLNKDTCECSSYFTFGQYEQDNDRTNGEEPITWRVLDVKDGKALLISEKALDVIPYNKTKISITWEYSTIRKWLNGYGASYMSDNFINAAFTTPEKAKIVNTNVPAHANPSYSTDAGDATTDKIFLLSIIEANQYFSSDNDRRAAATPYAIARSAYTYSYTDFQYSTHWWLRSPGSDTYSAATVSHDGSVNTLGPYVDRDYHLAVRPALWVNL